MHTLFLFCCTVYSRVYFIPKLKVISIILIAYILVLSLPKQWQLFSAFYNISLK